MHAAVENNGLSGNAFPTVVVLTGDTGLCRLEVVLVFYLLYQVKITENKRRCPWHITSV